MNESKIGNIGINFLFNLLNIVKLSYYPHNHLLVILNKIIDIKIL